MQEHQVTAAGQTHALPSPFFVLATQNPIEQEGTYPLPEAQLDRFMFELRVGYPSKDEEERIVESTTGDLAAAITPVLTAEDVLTLQHLVRRFPVPKPLMRAAVTLVRMTRPPDAEAPPFIKQYISWGAGPRASQYLILGAKARAALDGRPMPDEDDLRGVAATVLTHRLVINFAAEAAGRSAPDLVQELLVTKTWLERERGGRNSHEQGHPGRPRRHTPPHLRYRGPARPGPDPRHLGRGGSPTSCVRT